MSDARLRLPVLLDLYARYLENQDSAAFVTNVGQSYTQGSLERLTAHPLREVRRAAVLALGFVGDYDANHPLGCALTDSDRNVRMLAENSIRSIWVRAGGEVEQQQLAVICRLIAAKRFMDAVQRATVLIDRAPWYAEAWNQRAIAYFSMNRYREAIDDCHQALEINPYHFPAAAGMGQAYLELGRHADALEAFRRALRLNPDLEAVRVQVVRLARSVEEDK